MKNKNIILIVAFFILFVIMIFATPMLDNKTASMLWILFFFIACLFVIIWTIFNSKVLSKERIIDEFKKEHVIIKILDIVFIIAIIYEIITLSKLNISLWILGLLILIKFCQWFFKKEE